MIPIISPHCSIQWKFYTKVTNILAEIVDCFVVKQVALGHCARPRASRSTLLVARIDLDRPYPGMPGAAICVCWFRGWRGPKPVASGSLEGTRMHRRADEQHARADRHGNGEGSWQPLASVWVGLVHTRYLRTHT